MDSKLIMTFALYAGMITMFYIFFIRPQNKQKKEVEYMRNNIAKGDKIVTIGGMIASVLNVEGDNVIIALKPNDIKMTIKKWAVREKTNK